jgi:hypothetical protein
METGSSNISSFHSILMQFWQSCHHHRCCPSVDTRVSIFFLEIAPNIIIWLCAKQEVNKLVFFLLLFLSIDIILFSQYQFQADSYKGSHWK